MEVQSATQLTAKKCLPCEGGVEACSLDFSSQQLNALPEWQLSEDGKSIARVWKLKNFVQAVGLINTIAEVAEVDQHHPDLHLTDYRKVRVELTTHAIGGLSENDFILAAKIDSIARVVGL